MVIVNETYSQGIVKGQQLLLSRFPATAARMVGTCGNELFGLKSKYSQWRLKEVEATTKSWRRDSQQDSQQLETTPIVV